MPWDECYHEDRGDGAVIVVPPSISTMRVVDPLIRLAPAGSVRDGDRHHEEPRPGASRTSPAPRPRLAEPEPFFALDPDHLSEPPRKAASISGAARSARRVTLAELDSVDLVVMGCVAAAEDGARLGKGGGFADLEFALASVAGLIGPDTVTVTTVHELQVRPPGTIPLTGHDVPLDFIVTPDRVIDCRARRGPRPTAGIRWQDLTEEKIAAIPLLAARRARLAAQAGGSAMPCTNPSWSPAISTPPVITGAE
ncbi:MAG: 5-formyltetrahydrofolate cyclo-ligase [Streptosporangiaceae bacterium]